MDQFIGVEDAAGGEPDVVMACAGDTPTLETLAAVRSCAPLLPIVVLTGADDEQLAIEAFKRLSPTMAVAHHEAAIAAIEEQLAQVDAALGQLAQRHVLLQGCLRHDQARLLLAFLDHDVGELPQAEQQASVRLGN